MLVCERLGTWPACAIRCCVCVAATDRQLVLLQQALVDKYEDIREQIFSAEQMARYQKFENARLQNVLLVRGRTEDVAIQTMMPGEDAECQVNFPKLPRLIPFDVGTSTQQD
eukprot:COSAG01_NODE_3009_length_6729_cov_42.834842_3_plen_112_part_00